MENPHDVIVNCSKQFPNMRFGQYIFNVLDFMRIYNYHSYNIISDALWGVSDSSLADACKHYNAKMK